MVWGKASLPEPLSGTAKTKWKAALLVLFVIAGSMLAWNGLRMGERGGCVALEGRRARTILACKHSPLEAAYWRPLPTATEHP
jgi:hypothetical protein